MFYLGRQNSAHDILAHDHLIRQLRPTQNEANPKGLNRKWNSSFQHKAHQSLSKKAHEEWFMRTQLQIAAQRSSTSPSVSKKPRAADSFYQNSLRRQRQAMDKSQEKGYASSFRRNQIIRENHACAFDRAVNTHVPASRNTRTSSTSSTTRHDKNMTLEEHTRYAEELMYKRKAIRSRPPPPTSYQQLSERQELNQQQRHNYKFRPGIPSSTTAISTTTSTTTSTTVPPSQDISKEDANKLHQRIYNLEQMLDQQLFNNTLPTPTKSASPTKKTAISTPLPPSKILPSLSSQPSKENDKNKEALAIQKLLDEYRTNAKRLEDQVNSLWAIVGSNQVENSGDQGEHKNSQQERLSVEKDLSSTSSASTKIEESIQQPQQPQQPIHQQQQPIHHQQQRQRQQQQQQQILQEQEQEVKQDLSFPSSASRKIEESSHSAQWWLPKQPIQQPIQQQQQQSIQQQQQQSIQQQQQHQHQQQQQQQQQQRQRQQQRQQQQQILQEQERELLYQQQSLSHKIMLRDRREKHEYQFYTKQDQRDIQDSTNERDRARNALREMREMAR